MLALLFAAGLLQTSPVSSAPEWVAVAGDPLHLTAVVGPNEGSSGLTVVAAGDGTLRLWLVADAGPAGLTAELGGGRRVASPIGDGSVAFLELEVREGQALTVEPSGPGTLHRVAGPESEVTRVEADRAATDLERVDGLLAAGDHGAARALLVEALERLVATPGAADSVALEGAAEDLGLAAARIGAYDSAGVGLGHALSNRVRSLPPDHVTLLRTRGNLGLVATLSGDFRRARELQEAVLAQARRTSAPDSEDLLGALNNLALTLETLGEYDRAIELELEALAIWTEIAPVDHPGRLMARLNLAITRKAAGEVAQARAIEEEVLAIRARTLPEDDVRLLSSKHNLAGTLLALGDLAGAVALTEEVLAVRERVLPPDDLDLLRTRQNLAVMLQDLGQFEAARALLEEVDRVKRARFGADHPDTLVSRENLAAVHIGLDQFERARELLEGVLAAHLASDMPDPVAVVRVRTNLAVVHSETGDLAGAIELERDVVRELEGLGAAGHLRLLDAREHLAISLRLQGQLAEARALQEQVLADRERLGASGGAELVASRLQLAWTLGALGEREATRDVLGALLVDQRAVAARLALLAPGQIRSALRAELSRTHAAFGLCLANGAEGRTAHVEELFETYETLRLASVAQPAVAVEAAGREDLRDLRAAVGAASEAVQAHAAAGTDADLEAWRAELARLSLERDRLQGRLRSSLGDAVSGPVRRAAVAARLGEGEAVATFLRRPAPVRVGGGDEGARPDELVAFTLGPDAEVDLVELGPVADLEASLLEWRRALGRPLDGRPRANDDADERGAGQRLRAALLDPILARVGTVATLHVVPDDLVWLVPLDALPVGDADERVGDRVTVRTAVALGPPTVARDGRGQASLVAVGGIDYDADAVAPTGVAGELLAYSASPPATRSSGPATFASLDQTLGEVAAVAARYAERFERPPTVLAGADATKAAVVEALPTARFLHLATHGWFSGDEHQSLAEGAADPRVARVLRGFAPETLCGVALAGANAGRDAGGRAAGVLTAEELSVLDLSACRLAVLSACETNVGVSRGGQGIGSLQAALHAAGAESALTSLWVVDDAATRRLMELFYTLLWNRGQAAPTALWGAKEALRREGYPARDWAGWVLTGAVD